MYNWFVIRDSFVETPSIQGELTNSKNFRYDDWLTPTYLYFAPDFSPRDYDGRVSNSTRSSYVYRCISTGWSQNFLEARCSISAQPEEEDPRWRVARKSCLLSSYSNISAGKSSIFFRGAKIYQ